MKFLRPLHVSGGLTVVPKEFPAGKFLWLMELGNEHKFRRELVNNLGGERVGEHHRRSIGASVFSPPGRTDSENGV
jgi:hypothetical protein